LPKKGHFVLQACKGLALAIEKQTEKSLHDTTEVAQLCAKYVQSMGSFGHAIAQIDTLVLAVRTTFLCKKFYKNWLALMYSLFQQVKRLRNKPNA
jgi:hypothetical protein